MFELNYPLSVGPGNQIRDRLGRTIAVAVDWQHAEAVGAMETTIARLEEQVNDLEADKEDLEYKLKDALNPNLDE